MTERHDGAPSDPQEHLLAFLSDGGSYSLPGAEVERITTHAAHVFLVGGRAYKMKRAVATASSTSPRSIGAAVRSRPSSR